jgi:hypothetical protein
MKRPTYHKKVLPYNINDGAMKTQLFESAIRNRNRIIFLYGFSGDKSKSGGDQTFLIRLPDTPETCLAELDKISKDDSKLLSKIE